MVKDIGRSKPAAFATIYPANSNSAGFLYIEYVSNSYNKSCHRQEFVISVVKIILRAN
jgi:hypothetical protein